MENTAFSVSMCVYGGDEPEWFKAAVDSVIEQSCPPEELVLVVDGPVPEKLNAIIAEYESRDFFKVHRLETNQGHGNARRAGLALCKNQLVALMDADDISAGNRFELQLAKFAADKDLDAVGGNISEFDGSPENITGKRVVPESDGDIKEYMKRRCPMNQVTVMFKKASVEAAGGYLDWFCEEDYYLWIRMSLAGMRFANCSETLVNVRSGDEQYKRRCGLRYFASEARLQGFMLRKHVIGFPRYLLNIAQRAVLQLLLPDRLRVWAFKNLARERSA